MALSANELRDHLNDRQALKEARGKWAQNNALKKNLDGVLARSWMPDGSDLEYKDLMRKARSPWLKYAARVIAQGLIVDGYSDSVVWNRVWQASGMDGRQSALNEQVASYGYGYLLTFPGDSGVFMRPLSVLNTHAIFDDPWDSSPSIVIHRVSDKHWRVFDSEAMYDIRGSLDRFDEAEVVEHGAGVNPVTIIPSSFMIDGLPESLVEPGIPAYRRIVDATFALQMKQRYAGFPQKWQTGGEIETDENGNAYISPSVDSLLHSDDPASRFGNFAEGDITQVVAAVERHIQDLAVHTQIPPHYLLGRVVNLSSDALAAVETSYNRLIGSVKEAAGEGYEHALRVGAALIGDEAAAKDLSSEIHWKDTSVRSLAASVDAVQKLVATGMDREHAYRLVPGFTQADVVAAAMAADEKEARTEELARLAR